MSKRNKYRLLSIPTLIVAAALAGGSVFLFWHGDLTWILFTSITQSMLIYILLIVLGLYCSKFWAHKGNLGLKLLGWGLTTLILLAVVGLGIKLSWEGMVTILLDRSGEIIQGKIINCEVKTLHGQKYFEITYQIKINHDDKVTGKGELSGNTGCIINQPINVFYLPVYPTISRTTISNGMVFMSLFWNFFLCLMGCVYFWIEKPKCIFNF